MTPKQAADLQAKWEEQKHSYRCPHAALDMEWTEDGRYTGNYRCRSCGDIVDPSQKSYRSPST
jgi:rubredoxin